MIKYSIVVILYNIEINKLKKCFTSLCNQSVDSYEVLVIDDGSNKEVAEYCDSFWKEQTVSHRVLHKENGGASSARNMGIQNAVGDYLLFVDGDDYVSFNYLSTIDALPKTENMIIYFSHYDIISGQVDDKKLVTYADDELIQIPNEDKVMIYRALFYNHLGLCKYPFAFGAVWNALYDRKLIADNNLSFDERLRRGQDAVFNMNYIEHCQHIYYYNKSLYYYNIYEGTAVTGYKKTPDSYLQFINATDEYTSIHPELRQYYYEHGFNYFIEMLTLHYFHPYNHTSYMRKRDKLVKCLNDKQIAEIIENVKISSGSKKKRLLLFLLRHKLTLLTNICVNLFGRI